VDECAKERVEASGAAGGAANCAEAIYESANPAGRRWYNGRWRDL